MEKFSGWIASLSNGTTVFQTANVDGEPSSWQKLLRRLREETHVVQRKVMVDDKEVIEEEVVPLTMSMLRYQHNGRTVHCMPPKMCDGYYHAYDMHKRFVMADKITQKKEKLFAGVGSVVGDVIFINWIDLDNGEVYQHLRPVVSPEGSNSLLHTTLYEEPNGQRSRNKAAKG